MNPQATIFHFKNYSFDFKQNKIDFTYQIDFSNRPPLDFTESIFLPDTLKSLDLKNLQIFLEPLHLILGISYFKLYFPPEIISPYKLSKDQSVFWNTVYKKGLGEFMYRNKLDSNKLAKFLPSTNKSNLVRVNVKNEILLGLGGGKDSIVATKLLDQYKITNFLVETQKEDAVSRRVAQELDQSLITLRRKLDPKILGKIPGTYNGHIPISAIYAFLGLFAAAIYKYKYVVVANEYSSNFGNLRYRGAIINHQWSKSGEFEKLFQEYIWKFITPDITYFSILRQFSEIRIARMFSQYPIFFGLFSSCNRSYKISGQRPMSKWCGSCPKCAFVFLILSPFINKTDLINIFPKNLLAEKSLIPLYKDLLGFGSLKPFDCVGTFEEAQAALYLAAKHYQDEVVTKALLPKIKNPQKLLKQVFKTVFAPTLPTPFRFLGIKNVCVVGYGKEGKISEEYLKKNYPNLKIAILDQKLDLDYLKKQTDFDLAVKTPGIPKTKIKIPYVTATNIFFSQIKNLTIGITGSKGKSTTASLIFDILKTAGKKVRLLGNIGQPMLEVLLSKIDPQEIFVIELSSYMLDDIEYSPNIAVLLDLFPDHMDYHGGAQKYFFAKQNIFKFQKPGDLAVKRPFIEKIPLQSNEIPLLGEHNLRNIQAAVKVARLLNISDTAIKKAVKNFKPLPHRLEYVGIFRGIKFYDDAISTTPESTIAAIKTLVEVRTIFLGGEDRGYDFRELEKILREYQIKNIVLFPVSGNRILKFRQGFNILETRDMKSAVDFAFQNTPVGQICLLSTASPSYTLWKNFEEKGNLFQHLVRKY